jgi:hypothetical protein
MKNSVKKITAFAFLLLTMGLSVSAQTLASYAGDWVNVDASSRQLVKISVAVSGATATIHPWGSCTPLCDWGVLPATPYAPNVSTSITTTTKTMLAEYNTPAIKHVIEVELAGDVLIVETFVRFTDGSGRSSYTMTDKFRRGAPVPTGLPDLVISSVTEFQLAYNNTQVQYTHVVKNTGSTDCKRTVALQGFWSKDATKSDDDVPSGGVTVGPIPANQSLTGKFTMNVPNPAFYAAFKGVTLPQMLKNYPYLILVVDSNSEVPESNEGNNVFVVRHGL